MATVMATLKAEAEPLCEHCRWWFVRIYNSALWGIAAEKVLVAVCEEFIKSKEDSCKA